MFLFYQKIVLIQRRFYQGRKPDIIINEILKVFEDYEYIESLKQRLNSINELIHNSSLNQSLSGLQI
jgi:hypothetical protein